MTETPTKPGWYWIRDEEIVSGSPWVMAHLGDGTNTLRLYTPDNNQDVWLLLLVDDGVWYSDSDDEFQTECRPLEWVPIPEPRQANA